MFQRLLTPYDLNQSHPPVVLNLTPHYGPNNIQFATDYRTLAKQPLTDVLVLTNVTPDAFPFAQ